MARVGYIEARKERDEALKYVEEKEIVLANVEIAEGMQPFHIKDAKAALANARIELEKAEKEFAVFNITKPKPIRTHFDARFNTCVCLDSMLLNALVAEQKAKGVSAAEVIRRALKDYLMPNDDPTT